MKNDQQHATPVVLLIFNRPETTARVFAEIAKVKPTQLLIVADGPRPDHPDDAPRCQATREVVEQVDWDCEVLRDYSDVNLGSGKRVASGLDWVFSVVEQAIILEDDCVPDQTFFPYCQALLARYRDVHQVMMISGDNFLSGHGRDEYSYYFSRYGHCWGWATWRRAWKHFDYYESLWPSIRDGGWLYDILQNRAAVKSWSRKFESVYGGRDDIWDYQWILSCWAQGGLSVTPHVNMVSNIGFGDDATHTFHRTSIAQLPAHAVEFPLRHPPFIIRDADADAYLEKNRYGSGLNKRLKRPLAAAMRRLRLLDS